MRTPTVVKWAVVVVALVGLAPALHWIVTQPALVPPPRLGTPLFVQIVTGSEHLRPPPPAWYALLTMSIAAVTILGACTLSLLILLRTATTAATRHLAAALALGAFAGAYFYFIRLFPADSQLAGIDRIGAWKFAADAAAYMAAFTAAYLLMRFFQAYPRQPTDAEWRAHYERHEAEVKERLSRGWRSWAYPGALVLRARASKSRASGIGPSARANLRRMFASPWILVLSGALALYSAGVDSYGLQAALSGAVRGSAPDRIGVQLSSWSFGLGGMLIVMLMALGYEALKFHHTEAVAADRAKIDWIYGAGVVLGLLAASVAPLWWAASMVLVPRLEANAVVISPVVLIGGPFVLALELFLLGFVASLALSIFYRGAIDPRLAARRITFFSLMSIVVTFLFVFLERTVTTSVVAWLGSPPETGIVIAGAIVAATFSPIRERTEKAVNVFIARVLPLEALMEGERKVAAVVLSDLSGYTALSERDEKQALLVAALLQRQAHMAADEFEGRVVKSMGDAVVMTFHDAAGAAKALAALHGRFGDAAKSLGLTPLAVHSGAHIGEVTETGDGDIYGQTVNIAARLQALAQPGQRVASEIFANSANLGEAQRRSLGLHKLKNVAEPMSCVELA